MNSESWASAIGFSVYAFEGIGLILPIQDVSKYPETYWKVVLAVIISVCTVYISFGIFCAFAWGDK